MSSHDSAELDSERVREAVRAGADASRESAHEPFLYLAFRRDDLMAPPARLRLTGLERVVVGRGDPSSGPAFDPDRLELRLGDRYASLRHAVLAFESGRWMLNDQGAINRTWVNGIPVQRIALCDGDWIEFGHTVCHFGFAPAPAGAGERWWEVRGEPWLARGLETIVPNLEHAYAKLARVAPSSLSLLILGETGTGKELIAAAVP